MRRAKQYAKMLNGHAETLARLAKLRKLNAEDRENPAPAHGQRPTQSQIHRRWRSLNLVVAGAGWVGGIQFLLWRQALRQATQETCAGHGTVYRGAVLVTLRRAVPVPASPSRYPKGRPIPVSAPHSAL